MTHDESYEGLHAMIRKVYNYIAMTLGEMTPPIGIPRLGSSPEEHMRGIDALERARAILLDHPSSATDIRAIRILIVEWATLYELAATIEEAGSTELRRAAADASVYRIILLLGTMKE